ncbi:hypothetical protein HMPREF0262_00222 [Clostridium sp. ATCC 29733]|nr:hypothetical protein HMPREF0262_00222 [Clostridium sp. ATCC 29733]
MHGKNTLLFSGEAPAHCTKQLIKTFLHSGQKTPLLRGQFHCRPAGGPAQLANCRFCRHSLVEGDGKNWVAGRGGGW